MSQRLPPDDPREWLNRARSDLALAGVSGPGVYLEDLCFHAQQAVEKAAKGVLVQLGVRFPYVHDIARLLTLVEEAGVALPEISREAQGLTRFAVWTRYPGLSTAVSEEEHVRALRLAREFVDWAAGLIEKMGAGGPAA